LSWWLHKRFLSWSRWAHFWFVCLSFAFCILLSDLDDHVVWLTCLLMFLL
jgi:hypothetical protein